MAIQPTFTSIAPMYTSNHYQLQFTSSSSIGTSLSFLVTTVLPKSESVSVIAVGATATESVSRSGMVLSPSLFPTTELFMTSIRRMTLMSSSAPNSEMTAKASDMRNLIPAVLVPLFIALLVSTLAICSIVYIYRRRRQKHLSLMEVSAPNSSVEKSGVYTSVVHHSSLPLGELKIAPMCTSKTAVSQEGVVESSMLSNVCIYETALSESRALGDISSSCLYEKAVSPPNFDTPLSNASIYETVNDREVNGRPLSPQKKNDVPIYEAPLPAGYAQEVIYVEANKTYVSTEDMVSTSPNESYGIAR